MRRSRSHGPCAECGRSDSPALYWESFYLVLDFGVDTMDPIEPKDLGIPVLCDRCELQRRLVETRKTLATLPEADRERLRTILGIQDEE